MRDASIRRPYPCVSENLIEPTLHVAATISVARSENGGHILITYAVRLDWPIYPR